MSAFSQLSRVDVQPWIKHFEEQAVKGVTKRSHFNSHYIVVGKAVEEIKEKADQKDLPQLVTPVQQSVEQAELEIEREKKTKSDKKDEELYLRQVPLNKPLAKKRKRPDISWDIFKKSKR